METREDLDRDEIVTDLGPASEVTLGVWDPIFKENFVTPQRMKRSLLAVNHGRRAMSFEDGFARA